MTVRFKWVALCGGVLLLSGGIGRAIVARKAQQSELAQSTASAQAEVQTLAPRDVFTVQVQTLLRSVPISGNLVAQRSAMVKAKVAGEVLQLAVREGDRVKQGQVLATIDPHDAQARLQQAEQQAASSKAQADIAQQTLDNNRALVQQGFISRSALDASVSNAAAAKATHEAALAAVNLARKGASDTQLRAPLSGLVSQRLVQWGERVNVDARVLEIIDLDSLELQAALTPADVARVRVGMLAQVQVDGVSEPIQAKVARINPGASPETRAITVYLSLPQHPALRQGLFAQGALLLEQSQGLAVPASAISRDGGQDEVLRIEGDHLVRSKLALGPRAGIGEATRAWVEVVQGLQAGDRIVTQAASALRDGAKVRVAPAP